MNPDDAGPVRRRGQLAALCAATFAVLMLAVAVPWGAFVRADRSLAARTNDWARSHHFLVRVAMLVSDVARPETFQLAAAVTVVALSLRRQWRIAATIGTATLAGMAAVAVFKALIRRPRPLVSHPFAHPHGWSFPSSHALTAATAVTVYILVLVDVGVGPRVKRAITVFGSTLAVIVGASRVVLGVHYLSDVLAGLLLGFALATASILIWRPSSTAAATRTTRHPPL